MDACRRRRSGRQRPRPRSARPKRFDGVGYPGGAGRPRAGRTRLGIEDVGSAQADGQLAVLREASRVCCPGGTPPAPPRAVLPRPGARATGHCGGHRRALGVRRGGGREVDGPGARLGRRTDRQGARKSAGGPPVRILLVGGAVQGAGHRRYCRLITSKGALTLHRRQRRGASMQASSSSEAAARPDDPTATDVDEQPFFRRGSPRYDSHAARQQLAVCMSEPTRPPGFLTGDSTEYLVTRERCSATWCAAGLALPRQRAGAGPMRGIERTNPFLRRRKRIPPIDAGHSRTPSRMASHRVVLAAVRVVARSRTNSRDVRLRDAPIR